MSGSTMVRKQLYITQDQERALKDRAREEGATEAEIVREALDRHLRYESSPFVPEERRKLVEDLIRMNEQVSRKHRFPKGYTFDRDELYAEREKRWLKDDETK